MARPITGRQKRHSMGVPEDVYNLLKEAAERENMPITQVLRLIVKQWCKDKNSTLEL